MSSNIRSISIIRRFSNGDAHPQTDMVAIEEPLELRVEGKPTAVLMRTPGEDLNLCRGFLYTEGVIEDRDDIHAIAHIDSPSRPKGNTVDVRLSSGVPLLRREKAKRSFFASSSCGICGKESIERVITSGTKIPFTPTFDESILFSLPQKLLSKQQSFSKTGGIHAVGLFDTAGNLLYLEEDIGRHNALDKVIGKALEQDALPLSNHILLFSGRASFELLQKAWTAKVPIVVAIGAPSSLAVDLAQKAGIMLYAFLRENRCNQYTMGIV